MALTSPISSVLGRSATPAGSGRCDGPAGGSSSVPTPWWGCVWWGGSAKRFPKVRALVSSAEKILS